MEALTEVLMLESVDRLIVKRLSLRPYNRCCAGNSSSCAKPSGRRPTGGSTPPAHSPACCPASSHATSPPSRSAAPPSRQHTCSPRYDAVVTFLAGDLGCVERVESRMATEALGSMFEGYVAQAGPSLPDFVDIPGPLDLVVLDPGALSDLSAACRMEFIAHLQRLSGPTCVHVILSSCPSLAPDSLLSFYEGWTAEDGGRRRAPRHQHQAGGGPRALASLVSSGHDGPAVHRVITTRAGSAPVQ